MTQRPSDPRFVDITYDLSHPQGVPCRVWIYLSKDGGLSFPFPPGTVSGDAGNSIPPGTGKHIVWNAYRDYPDEDITQAVVRVNADASTTQSSVGYGDSPVVHLNLYLRTLTVTSAHGSPSPSGTTYHIHGENLMASVQANVAGPGTRYYCTGWTGTGSVPGTGSANMVFFLISQDSTLAWNWQSDSSIPTVPGTPTDGGVYTSRTAVTFRWTGSSDTGSGIGSYGLQVGTRRGLGNVFNGEVGNVLAVSVGGANGQRLYARVRALDRAGNASPWSASSDGILIDTAAPAAPGVPADTGSFTSSTAVRFTWTAATDPGTTPSGVASYDLRVGTAPGWINVFNANVGNARTRVVNGANGQTLYARVRARDSAGNLGLWSGDSDGIAIDTVRPRLTGATARDYCSVTVTFNEPVLNGDRAANYVFSGGLRAMRAVRLSGWQFRVSTTDQTPGTSYTVTVGSAVKDQAGNPLDPAYASRAFRGGIKLRAGSWELYR
jgi:hypothetical protein